MPTFDSVSEEGNIHETTSSVSGFEEAQEETPFSRAPSLPLEELNALVRHCTQRIRSLANEMGRAIPGHCTGWMGRRERWLNQYNNDWSYRQAEERGVFEHSNYSMNFAKRVCAQLVARTNREFFGSEPYFAVIPEGNNDVELAEKINRRSQWKFSKSNAKAALRESVKYSYILGERVVKVSYLQQEKKGLADALVLVDENGEAFLTPEGGYIQEDDWVEIRGRWFCVHDLAFEMPESPQYEWRKVERNLIQYKGPHISGVHFRDFLCPLNTSDIHQTDFICHLYDQSLWTVAQTYNRLDLVQPDRKAPQFLDVAKKALGVLGFNNDPKSSLAQPQQLRGEESQFSNSQGNPIVQVAECYLKYDVDGDGLPEDLCVILALPTDAGTSAELIYYDFCINILPNGRWPFEVVRRNPDEGRWYGVGVFEEFSHKQDFIDLHFNRINFRNMATGTIKFWKSQDVEEEKEPLTIGDDKIWTPKENVDPKKIFTSVPLIEPTEAADTVMQYMMQSFQLEAGVTSEGDGRAAQLPSSETATGILSNERVADELSHSQISDLEDGLSKVIHAAVLMDYFHMDPVETYEYLEGSTARIEHLSREEVENLSMNVRLLLTKRRSRQLLATNSQAIEMVEAYIRLIEKVRKLELPPEVITSARPLFIQTLKSLDIHGAEEIFLDPFKVNQSSTETIPEAEEILLRDLIEGNEEKLKEEAKQPTKEKAEKGKEETGQEAVTV